MEVSAAKGFRERPGWLLVVAALLIGQGWLTLRQFSPDLSIESLLNDEPIVAGRHSLHLYHGILGAKAWSERGNSSCFDPAFQAGYPKTPVFDGGSRPAELFLLIGAGQPAAYKIGLALLSLLAPLAFVAMARGIGLAPAASCVAGFLGGAIWWSDACQALYAAGDADLLLGGLCVLVHVAWFVRFEREPGLDSWFMMTLFATLAWYTQPLLVVGFLPFLLLYYLWVAFRQGLIWHLAVASAIFLAFGANANWLIDWSRHLWLYLPFGGQAPPAAPFWTSVMEKWTCLLPSDPVHQAIAATGLLGLLMMIKTNRAAAWLLGLGTLEYAVAAGAGKFYPALAEFGTERFLLIAAWCLVLPAALIVAAVGRLVGRAIGGPSLGTIALIAGLAAAAWCIDLPRAWLSRPGLEIGLNSERKAIVQVLNERTTPEARILWEDREGPAAGWTALLAKQTDRSFLGGLDAAGRVEHMYARLCDGKLGGKAINDWDDASLTAFLERYNVGWIVCWSPESIQRFRKLAIAKPLADVSDGRAGVLFALERKPSFFLKGSGQWVMADSQRIALADIAPENGELVLSIHYQSKMRVWPSYVQIERDLDLDDPIPFIRLRVPGPVARVSIIWEP